MANNELLSQLQRLGSPEDAWAAITAYEKKRKDQYHVKYWMPCTTGQWSAVKSFTPDVKVLGIRGGNRCLAGSTLVATPTGGRRISRLSPGQLVYAIDGSAVPIVATYENGPRQLYRWHGKRRNTEVELEATAEHKIWGASEKDNTPRLIALGDLKDRSYFARHEGIEFGEQENPYALLLGLILGDGYIGADLQWTCAEPELVDLMRPYIESLGFKLVSRGIQHYIRAYTCAKIQRNPKTGRILGASAQHPLRLELQRLGLDGARSRTKFIPEEVWDWTKADVAQLLAGLIATDGSVFKGSGTWHVGYTSASRDLIEGFRDLLAKGFGIYGSEINKGSKGSWNVTYGTAQAFERLAQLPVPGRKGRLLREAVGFKKDSKSSLIHFVERESLGEQETYDIQIAHPSHVFLLDNNLAVGNSGKTELGAAIATAWALGKEFFNNEPAWEWVKDLPIPEPPSNIWVVGLDFALVRDVIWREKLRQGQNHPPFFPKDDNILTKVSDSDYQARFANGSTLTCKSADSGREKFQGASVDLVWIDEECEEEVFNECYQRTVDCAGKIVVTLTPLTDVGSGNRIPWVFDLYEDTTSGRSKDVKFVSLSVLDNPHVPAVEKEKLQEKWAGHPEEKARLYGEFVQRSGLIYPQFGKTHIVKPFQIPKDWYRVACIDPAPTGTTACIWAAVESGTNNLFFYREYYNQDQNVSDHAKDILVRGRGEPIDLWLIDPKAGAQRNNESRRTTAQLYRDAGIPVRLAEIDEDYGLNASREYIGATLAASSRHPKAFFFETLENFRWEISRYVWASYGRGEMKGLSKEKPVKRNDHLMNATQYICAFHPKGRARGNFLSREELLRQSKTNSYT